MDTEKRAKKKINCEICGIPEVYRYCFCKECYFMVKDEKILSDSAVEDYLTEKRQRRRLDDPPE